MDESADDLLDDEVILGALFESTPEAPPVAPLRRPARELVHGHEGIGRLVERDLQYAHIEYFDHPGEGGLVRRKEPHAEVRHAFLAPQLRVHWQTPTGWDHGRVVEHRRDEERVVVRAVRGRELLLDEEA